MGFHCGEYIECGLSDCDAVQVPRCLPMFRRNPLSLAIQSFDLWICNTWSSTAGFQRHVQLNCLPTGTTKCTLRYWKQLLKPFKAETNNMKDFNVGCSIISKGTLQCFKVPSLKNIVERRNFVKMVMNFQVPLKQWMFYPLFPKRHTWNIKFLLWCGQTDWI
jgi:hypothetical protein